MILNPIYIPNSREHLCLKTRLETSNMGHLYVFSVEGTNNGKFETTNGYYLSGDYMEGQWDESWTHIYVPLSDLPKLVEELTKSKYDLMEAFERVGQEKGMSYNEWGDKMRKARSDRESKKNKILMILQTL